MISIKKVLKTLLIGILIIISIGFTSFYVLIGLGAAPKLQTIWVTTAMTTLNNKWLATTFISQKKIDKIMNENYVDDTGLDSELLDSDKFNNQSEDVKHILGENDIYIRDGYDKLEEGVYLKRVSDFGWNGYTMIVTNPDRVKLVDTAKQYEEGQTVNRMVINSGAVAGINGGGFVDGPNYDSNGGTPAGLIIENGVLIAPKKDAGLNYNMIGINKDGVLVLRHCTATWALENDIVSAVSFSPFLITNGEATIKSGTGGWGIAPRTAIGQRKSGEIVFLVIDGRQPTWSVGVDIKVVQDVLLEEKCINAALLDGGSSTVMMYNGEYVNKPSLGFERFINNCWVVMPNEE
ncbi:MAG: hypothetical protein K0R15_1756 [Clostridiales bacterium]|nr:hypothetical protein [Clostridiales bacterium]